MEGDQVGAHAHAEHPPAAVEVVLPQRLVPLRVAVAAEGVVDEDVEPAVVAPRSSRPARRRRRRPRGRRRGPALARPRRPGRRSPRSSRAVRSPRGRRPGCCVRSRGPRAPARASSTAMARPAPRVAPATRATRPREVLSMPISMPRPPRRRRLIVLAPSGPERADPLVELAAVVAADPHLDHLDAAVGRGERLLELGQRPAPASGGCGSPRRGRARSTPWGVPKSVS